VSKRSGVESAVDRKAEIAALKIVTEPLVVVVHGLFCIVVTVQSAVGDNVKAGGFLIGRDGSDRILKGFARKGIRRFLVP
jgi:hypothetical protein